jgi:CPA1 family monovalent cation:H+ antiporter/cell volume regulation protein A
LSFTLSLLLAVFGALLLVAVLLDDIAARLRVPGILLVLLLGLLTSNDVDALPTGPSQLLSLEQADQISQLALVLVLFFGGLTSNWQELRSVLRPALRLATLGSLLTAGLVTALVLLLGQLPITAVHPAFPVALFIGAMVCSTDASAVLVLLRPLAGHLPRRLIDLIECESAFNDPVAVVIAGVALVLATGHGVADPTTLLITGMRQFLLGALLGFLGGSLAAQMLVHSPRLRHPALLAVVSLAVLMLLVGATQLLGGSGILAAYVAGLVLGNTPGCDRGVLEQTHAGFAKMAELGLFLCLGLVVDPAHVVRDGLWVLVLFLVMQLARWLMVEAVLLRSEFRRADRLMITASGLRGAVPIALAIQAASSTAAWGREMPPLALGVVLLGLVLQGFSLVPLARRLGLASAG